MASSPTPVPPCEGVLQAANLEKLYRNPDRYEDTCYQWAGHVTQRLSDQNFVVRTSFWAPYGDGRIAVHGDDECIGTEGQQRVLEGDYVTFAGEFMFIQEYEMTAGPPKSWPAVECHRPTTSRSKRPEVTSVMDEKIITVEPERMMGVPSGK